MKPYKQSVVDDSTNGLTLEQYVKQVMHVSGRSIQRLTRLKAIRLNGKTVFLQKKLKAGDQVRVYEPEDQSFGVEPESGTLDILYEDANIIVANKPPFQLVHPTGQTVSGTLANVLAYYFQSSGHVHTIRPIHRLDRDTSGCIVFAKHANAQHQMEQQLQNGLLKRQYVAIVEGIMTDKKGTVEAAIGNHATLSNRRAIVPTANGEHAVTHFEVLDTDNGASIVKLSLETGRTHQIRLHMAHIGHPVIGDKMYGKRSAWITRQALHAYQIAFQSLDHTTQENTVYAPLPSDIRRLWKQISGEEIQDPQ